MTVAVVGLGALGSAFAHVAQQAGLDVVGVDADPAVRERIEAGDPATDPDIRAAFEPIDVMADHAGAAATSDTVFVFVSTPPTEDAFYDPTNVYDALDALAPGLEPGQTVAINATVEPGEMANLADWIADTGATLVYNPEFVARGALRDGFRRPQPLIFGVESVFDGVELHHVWTRIADSVYSATEGLSPAVMSYESAELAKIAFNTFTTIKMSFANRIALASDRFDADAYDILDAIRDDPRIGGPANLDPGLGFGGPCLPRDIGAFAKHVEAGDCGLAEAADATNAAVRNAVVHAVTNRTEADDRVGCLGTAYKPGVASDTDSEAAVIARLLDDYRPTRTYDPMAPSDYDDLDDLLEWADALVHLVPWPEFEKVVPDDHYLIDAWANRFPGHPDYYALGTGAP